MFVEVRDNALELNKSYFFLPSLNSVTLWDLTQVSGILVSQNKMKTWARMTKNVTSISHSLISLRTRLMGESSILN